MAQHGFGMAGGHGGGSIDPNNLAMSYRNNYMNQNTSDAFTVGGSHFQDDELMESLSPQPPMQDQQNMGGMGGMNMGFSSQGLFGPQHHGLPIDQSRMNGFSSTPDGDPIQSPFTHGFGQYQQMHTGMGGIPFAGSPLANSELNEGDRNFLKANARLSQAMQRKPSNTQSPLPPKAQLAGISINSDSGFGAQPIRTSSAHHEKSQSGQWVQTPNSLSSFPGSGFSSPPMQGLHAAQINDILLKGGASMPAKLGANPGTLSTQEAKRKRRRESHNLVERRRRDNINERIQDLSKLVPAHRLEDEKIRKAIQNGTPLSPTLAGLPSPTQATSGLAGPGARRATSGTAGNITTGLPIDEKDKGPNKGDILNGAVSWTRDLMWMLHLKIQQQEELVNCILEMGGHVPFEMTDDERRMQTELMETMSKAEDSSGKANSFSYSRTAGTGLRVPHHTDYKGEPLNGNGHPAELDSISPEAHDALASGELLDAGEFLDYDDDGSGDMNFKEEDEYGMDITQ